MKNSVFGLFRSRNELNLAIQALKHAGFNTSEISVLLPDHLGKRDFVYAQRTQIVRTGVIGAILGAGIVGTLGFLVAIDVLPMPGFANFTRLGLISTTLIFALFGLFFGTASGMLIGIGTPENAAERYGRYVSEGGTLLSIHVDQPALLNKAKEILEASGGQDVTENAEASAWSSAVHVKRKTDAQARIHGEVF